MLAFEITVPDSLVWPLPQDYVNYCRISVVLRDDVTNSYRIFPINVNRNINMAIGYLQDHNADLLFDGDGQILMADSLNAIAQPYKRYKMWQNVDSFNKSQFGEVNVDRRRFAFSSDLANKEVVIEYVSDGLQADLSESQITAHKYLRRTIEAFIYHSCIERKRNVPSNEKARAKQAYDTALHKSKLSLSGLDLREIARAVRSGNVLP